MVTQFTNCESCANKEGCMMKCELAKLWDDINEVDYKFRPYTVSNFSINIKCNKYQTDYGKGLGK